MQRDRPELLATLGELSVPAEFASLLLRLPLLAAQPRGLQESVLVFPGFGGGDGSTALIRRYLRYLGYRVDGWGLGSNRGNVPRVAHKTAHQSQRVCVVHAQLARSADRIPAAAP